MVRRVGIGVAVMAVSMVFFAASASAGTMSGRVTDQAGDPIAGISVCAIAPDYVYEGGCDSWTASDGTYAIEGLKSSPYYVRFYAPGGIPGDPNVNWAPQWYGGAVHAAESTQVWLSGGVAEGIDAVMQVGGRLSGKITDRATGAAVGGVVVCASEIGSDQYGNGSCSQTEEDGTYDVGDLNSGTYRVEFQTYNGPNYVREAYAGEVPVTAGQKTAGIDAALLPGLQIEGNVTDTATGRAPEWTQSSHVVPMACALDPVTEARVACNGIKADGTYFIPGLPVGNYVISFALDPIEDGYDFPDEFVRRFWREVSNFSEATPVGSPTPTVVSGIDAALTRGGEILPPGVKVLTPGVWPPSEQSAPAPAFPTTPGSSAAPAPGGQATAPTVAGDGAKKVCRKGSHRLGKGRHAHCVKTHGHPVRYHPDRDALRR